MRVASVVDRGKWYIEYVLPIKISMEIPPEKRRLFYLVSVPVFLVGLVLGAFLASYVFFMAKDKLCSLWQSAPPKVNTVLTSGQIEKAASLQQNTTIFGKVTAKDASSFTLQFSITNPLDTKNATTTTAKVSFDASKDEVIVIKQGSTAKPISGTFGDIKVDQLVLLKVLNDVKTVYITSP